MAVVGQRRVRVGDIDHPAGCLSDQIPVPWREICFGGRIPAKFWLAVHQPRPLPHPPAHGQIAGLAGGAAIVPDLEMLAAVAMEPKQV